MRTFILSFLRRFRKRPVNVAHQLPPHVLEQVMSEARFLQKHKVDVRPLEPGELPIPKRADE